MVLKRASSRVLTVSDDFKGSHYPKSVILYAVFFYVRYGVSYRDLEEIMEERGVDVDHATLNRWVVKFSPMIAANAQASKRPTAVSWRMDETYIKVEGRWTYYYRAVDNKGQTLDFMLSERRDKAATRRFFKWRLALMACRIGSSSTRARPIWRVWKASMSS
jgi:putative transposase